ncbi:MAG TPA: glycerol-3-phosphate 1-O-acyltransferase PlsY [Dehalococcoidia bacterium]|nr:glycerol-3-phosphate 1-O-acyltransferase PlsY [Dehalococcoidia bacterium]
MLAALAIVLGYLLGAFPSAYIAGRLLKKGDIRKLGGGNIGALNVYREVGPRAGMAVLAADMAKGILAVIVARWLGVPFWAVLSAGAAALVGHNWPVYIGFKGGKGAATTAGVFLALVPAQMAMAMLIMVLCLIPTRNVTLSACLGFLALPFLVWWLRGEWPLALYVAVLPSIVGLKHLPTARQALASRPIKEVVFDPWRRGERTG